MISEIDLLKEDIPRLEEKFGVDNLFVAVLKAQLAALQNPTTQQHQTASFHFDVKDFFRKIIFKKN